MNKNYKFWLDNCRDKETIDQLKEMNESTIEEAFYKDLAFGTGGIRGIIGLGTNRINKYIIRKTTLGLANYLNVKNKNNLVIIGYDNRNFSKEFADEAAKVLENEGIKAKVFKQLVPTPVVSYAINRLDATAGIIITASHNPKEYNGYKVYNETGAQVSGKEATQILDCINGIENIFEYEISDKKIDYIYDEIVKDYLNHLTTLTDYANSDLKITFTSLHGTAYDITKKMFETFRYDNVEYVKEQCIEDSNFTNTISSNPEEVAAYNLATEYAKKSDSDIIMATDPDADRLGVMIKKSGEYQLLLGTQIGLLLINYLLETNQKPNAKYLFKSLVTSDCGATLASLHNITCEETLAGFKYIGEKIEKLSDKSEFLFGYEESFGYLLTTDVRDKDAISTMLKFSEMASYYKSQGLTIDSVLESIYKKIGYFVNKTTPLAFQGVKGSKIMSEIMDHIRTNAKAIFNSNHVTDYLSENTGLEKENMIKVFLTDGWIAFRPSGTEPKLKVYYSFNNPNKDEAIARIDYFEAIVTDIISNIA